MPKGDNMKKFVFAAALFVAACSPCDDVAVDSSDTAVDTPVDTPVDTDPTTDTST